MGTEEAKIFSKGAIWDGDGAMPLPESGEGVLPRRSRALIPDYKSNRYGGRYVPFGAKTLQALKALHDREPASEIVLGAAAHRPCLPPTARTRP